MKRHLRRSILLLICIFSALFLGVLNQSLDPNPSGKEGYYYNDFQSPQASAPFPLSLNVKNESSTVSDTAPQNFTVSLNSGVYVVLVELDAFNSIDIILRVATDPNFNTVINYIDNAGIEGNERCIVRLTSSDIIYIQVISKSNWDDFSIIVSDNLGVGYNVLYLDNQDIFGYIDPDDSLSYYIDLQEGDYEVTASVTFLDIILNISLNPLLKTFIATSDNSGVSGSEKIQFHLNNSQTVFIKVTTKAGTFSQYVNIIVTEYTGSSTTDNDEKDKNNDTPFDDSFLFFLIIIILSAIGITIPTLYIINSRKKEGDKKSAKKEKKTHNKIPHLVSFEVQEIILSRSAPERMAESKGHFISLMSPKFLAIVDKFDWEAQDKAAFIREMSALPPERRREILKEMVLKSKSSNTSEGMI